LGCPLQMLSRFALFALVANVTVSSDEDKGAKTFEMAYPWEAAAAADCAALDASIVAMVVEPAWFVRVSPAASLFQYGFAAVMQWLFWSTMERAEL
jgi:hypothetical protein